MKARGGGGEGEKVWWVVMEGALKRDKTTPLLLQRMSPHLCDVKSKLINKGSRFQGVLSQIQGAQASHFHQLEESHMSKLSLSRRRRATFLVLMLLIMIHHFVSNQKGLAGSRRALHSRNQSPFQIFAPDWKSKKLRFL